ncbi:MAG: sugar phosphate isomerase/epimerase [Oscillospiraceae bacterium]|nr:sugar phosphate isomerase/epimerase [Oscillospiraceae bacterium]
MVNIGFSLQPKYDCPQAQVIELLSNAGFSAVSPVWSSALPLETLATDLQKHNMILQSLHAPHGGLSYLWNSQDSHSANAQRNITDCIDDCARFQIPLVVVHGWQGLDYIFPETPLDFSAFDHIVDHAERCHVSIAFENLEGEEYLEALLNRYRDRSHVGFCWDSGHDHCYPHKLNFLKAFGQRLIMTHLNDNLGQRDTNAPPTGNDDLHFLPYDGNIPWEHTLLALKGLPKQDILNFEIKKRSTSNAPKDLIYDSLSPEEFFRLAGQRALQIANLYEQIINA